MSSSSITVKPRRRPPQKKNSSANLAANQEKGTVLVRNAQPKYSFQQKLATKDKSKTKPDNGVNKENEASKTDCTKINIDDKKLETDSKSSNGGNQSEALNATTGVNIGETVVSMPPLPNLPFQPSIPVLKNESLTVLKTETTEKPVNKVGPISKNSVNTLSHSVSDSVINVTERSRISADVSHTAGPSTISAATTDSNPAPSPSAVCGNCQSTTGTEIAPVRSTGEAARCKCSEKVLQLEEEKQMLKNQLEVQLQVNQELKKLLVASVGEDVQHRVERLTRDKAVLSLEIGDYSKKICDGYEHLDNISIQADMWRSKYLACRVMSDELASSKAFYTMQFQESQLALEKMLNERHQLRANLYDTYRGLEQIQEAFDPLGSQTSGSRLLASKNVIDLARTNHQLVESIKYRLLPSHVTSNMSNKLEPDWHDYLTQAEAHAKELLSREMRPEDFRCLVPSLMPAPGAMSVDRYHPYHNYDNLTLNVCCKCKGEIRIV